MRALAARLFQLRPGEGRPVAVLAGFVAVSIGNVILLNTFNDATFLAVHGAETLPYLFIVSSLALSFASTMYGALAARVDERRLAVATPLAFAAAMVLCRALLPLALPGFVFALYVAIWIANGITAIASWNLARGAFDTRQVKRLMPLLGASAGLGATLAGLLANAVVPWIGTENLLLVGAALYAGAAALARQGREYLAADDEPAPARRETVWETTREGFGLIRRNRLMSLVTAMLVCSVVVKTLIDYQFKTSLRLELGKDEMAAFLGTFYAVANLLELGVQLALSGWLMRRFGLVPALASRPAVLGVLGLLAAARPGLPLFAGARLFDGLLNRTWYKAGTTQLFAPVPGRRANRIKLTQEGTIEPLVVVATAVLLLVLQRTLTLGQLGWPLVLAAAAWLALALRIDRLYLGELAHALETRLFDADQEVGLGELVNPATLARLAQQLASADREEVLFALRLAAETGAPLTDEVRALLEHPEPEVRREAAAALARIAPAQAGGALRSRLAAEPDAATAGHLLRVLTELADEGSLELAHELVRHPHPEVRAEALLLLFKHGGLDGIVAASYQLAALQAGGDEDRLTLARILGRLEIEHLDRTLLGLLRDPDPRVRRAALEAARNLRSRRVLDVVVTMFADPALRLPAERALVAAGPLGAELAQRELERAPPPGEPVAEVLLRVLAGAPRREALPVLERTLAHPSPRLRLGALTALGALRAHGAPMPLPALAALFRAELGSALVFACQLPARRGMLRRELEIGLAERVDHLFLALGLRHDPGEIASARRAVRGRDSRGVANALEYLDTLLPGAEEKLFLALLEEATPPAQLAARATEVLGFDPASPAALAAEAARDRWLALLVVDGAAAERDRIADAALLAGVDLFAALGLRELSEVAGRGSRTTLAAGEELALGGAAGPGLAVVAAGALELSPSAGAEAGERWTVAAGSCAGEAAALAPGVAAPRARAVVPTECLLLPAGELAELLERDAEVAAAVTAGLLARVRRLSEREAELRRGLEVGR